MSGVLTEYNQIAGQIINIVNEQHRQFEEPVADIDRIYAEFRARFSPDVLENLDDSELLQYIFLTADSDNTSLCYYLEFDPKIKSYFGSISGGSSFKFGLFQRQEDKKWMTGSPINQEVLSNDQALELGKHIRDCLVKGCAIIEPRELITVAEYENLDDALTEAIGKHASYAWFQKYFHMMFPQKFFTIYSKDLQNHFLYGLGIKPSEKYYGRNGQLALVMRQVNIPAPHFYSVLYSLFGNIKHFYRLGSSDQSNSYSERWKANGIVAVGWNKTGDLVNYLKKGVIDKERLARKLSELYYPADAKTASRKAGEIKTFYETNPDSVFVVMDGEKLIGFVHELSPYFYDDNEPMAHCKKGTWLLKFEDADRLPENEGLLTTCYEIKKESNLMFLYAKLYYGSSIPSHLVEQEDSETDVETEERKFRAWLSVQTSASGSVCTPSMVSANTNALKRVLTLIDIVEYPDLKSIFSIKDIDVFLDVKSIIRAHPDFDSINRSCGNGFLKSGLNWYEKYLNEVFSKPIVQLTPPESYGKDKFLEQVFMTEEEYNELVQLLLYKKNVILQGAPGVGKTFLARRFAYSIIGAKDDTHVEMIQFHQSYSYEDFIMGYKPNDDGFELRPGVFYSFCKRAEKDSDPNSKYFFIIDEINRGNLSKIFGELMMLIEGDKRGEKIKLAYKDELFGVPKNVYVIGMMNTADRSLAMMDYALRRRFSFYDIEPAFNKPMFRAYLERYIHSSDIVDKVINRFRELNNKIADEETSGLGKGFCIGHSYFCVPPVPGQSDIDWYRAIIRYEVAPLLDEYWWDDKNKAEDCKKDLLKD